MPNKPSAIEELSEKQKVFVETRAHGASKTAAAEVAGYHPLSNVEAGAKVKKALGVARKELSTTHGITRSTVIDGLEEAIRLARIGGDPSSMIKGWTEIAKILGLYAPEVKTINLTMGQDRLMAKFRSLTDAELLELGEGGVYHGNE